MKLFSCRSAQLLLALSIALPASAADVWVGPSGADNRCDLSLTTVCPTAAASPTCGRCSNDTNIICTGTNNGPCGGGATTCTADAALGRCRNTGCGTTQALACKTIERGAARAVGGDTVRVLAGEYHECIGVLQPITNFSIVADAFETSQDRTATVINGAGACDGPVIFRPTVTLGNGSSLRGFTVRGGGDTGVRALGSVVITRNIITGNTSSVIGLGGGIQANNAAYVYTNTANTSLRIEYNDVIDNTASKGGGGIYVLANSFVNDFVNTTRPVIVKGNLVKGNTTSDSDAAGGGIYIKTTGVPNGTTTVAITNNTIESNTNVDTTGAGQNDGGGIAAFSFTLGTHVIDITGNTIKSNRTSSYGGGMALYTYGTSGSNLSIHATGNTLEGNTARDVFDANGYGGGIWGQTLGFGTESIAITQNVVRSNTAVVGGGGIVADAYPGGTGAQHVSVDRNTIQSNTAETGGGLQLFLVSSESESTAVGTLSATENTILDNAAVGYYAAGGGLEAIHDSAQTAAPGVVLSIERNTITGNDSEFVGGGAFLWAYADSDALTGAQLPTSAAIRFANNLVSGNSAHNAGDDSGEGGGVYALLQALGQSTASMDLDFNTIVGNSSDQGAAGIAIESETELDPGDTFEGQAILDLSNSIVASNVGPGVSGPEPGDSGTLASGGTGNFDLSGSDYNDSFGNQGGNYPTWFLTEAGTVANLSFDPKLDAQGVPSRCSAAMDGADPAASFALEPAPNGQRANLGHLGATAAATTTLADINGDRLVDGVDFLRLATSFDSSNGQSRFYSAADLDADQYVGPLDLMYLAYGFGQSCR